MVKVECTECGGKYYVIATDRNIQLPKDIQPGEAFPSGCPLCSDGAYAIVADAKK
jgi:hypothetical protein